MSTATLAVMQEPEMMPEPAQRQKRALADRLVFVEDPVNRLFTTRSTLKDQWVAAVNTIGSFAELISLPAVTRNAVTQSFLDEPALALYWNALARRKNQSTSAVEEGLLDWDVSITAMSNRRSETVLANIEYRGRAKPRPVVDPWD